RVEIGPHEALAAQPVQYGKDLAFRQPLVAANEDAIHHQHVSAHGGCRRAMDAVREAGGERAVREHRLHQRAPVPSPARRLDVGATEARIGRGRDRAHDAVPSSAVTRRSGTVPIEPAPSVITTSPGFAAFTIAGTTSSSFGTTSTGAAIDRRTAAASASSVTPAIG